MESIRKKAVKATLWSTIDSIARQAVKFGLSLILARILSPTDYGTIALLSVFVGLANIFIDSGFSWALIQRKDITNIDISSVFYFNIILAIVCAGLLCLAAPWIALFYHTPILKPLTALLALNLVVGTLGAVQGGLLSKQLNFRRQCLISLTALSISGVVAIILALHGYGVWSLGMQSLVNSIVSSSLLWITSSWRPSLQFSYAAVRSLFGFGSFLVLTDLLNTLYTRLNTLVIGKLYSPNEVGIYARAETSSVLPGNLMSGIFGRAAFPIFAAAQDDKALLRAGLRKAITLVMLVNIPLMVGIAATARPLITLLYGERWTASAPFLQILSIGGILWPLHVLNLNVLIAQGQSRLVFRLEVIKKIIGLTLLGIACFFGMTAIAWSAVVTGVICFGINSYYSHEFLDYGAMRQTIDLLPYVCTTAVMAGAVVFTGRFFDSALAQVAAQTAAGAGVYILLCAMFRLRAFLDGWRILKPVLVNPWSQLRA